MATFGSLFAGIGGIDLGLERAGWECRWQVEVDGWCRRVLAKHWPDVTRYGDIRGIDWAGVEPVDLLAGGFPCQPVSVAGLGRGRDDPRWLWPEFARAVCVLRPRLVLVENVPGLLARGLGDVLGDMAGLGYDAEWFRLSAADVGAPHLRERVFIVARPVADADGRRLADEPASGVRPQPGFPAFVDARPGRDALADAGRRGIQPLGRPGEPSAPAGTPQGARDKREWGWDAVGDGRPNAGALADADGGGRGVERLAERPELGGAFRGEPHGRRPGGSGDGPMADPLGLGGRGWDGRRQNAIHVDARGETLRPGGDGEWWAIEPDVGRVAHGIPGRVDRLRGLGNAVVPQVAEAIGRWLLG